MLDTVHPATAAVRGEFCHRHTRRAAVVGIVCGECWIADCLTATPDTDTIRLYMHGRGTFAFTVRSLFRAFDSLPSGLAASRAMLAEYTECDYTDIHSLWLLAAILADCYSDTWEAEHVWSEDDCEGAERCAATATVLAESGARLCADCHADQQADDHARGRCNCDGIDSCGMAA